MVLIAFFNEKFVNKLIKNGIRNVVSRKANEVKKAVIKLPIIKFKCYKKSPNVPELAGTFVVKKTYSAPAAPPMIPPTGPPNATPSVAPYSAPAQAPNPPHNAPDTA